MAQWSFPFADLDGDKLYNDDDFSLFYDNLFTDGVFATVGDALRVRASAEPSMKVVIKNGAAIITGRQYMNTGDVALELPVASSTQDRMDSIVLRLDITARKIELTYKQDSTSVERTEEIYELQLATVQIPSKSTVINNSQITDKRSDESVCGYSSPYEKVSVSGLEQQYESLLIEMLDDFESNAEDFQDSSTTLFQEWFDNLQDQLDENQTTNLQNQIDELTASNDTVEIEHNLGFYPSVQVLYWEYGLGTVDLEEQPEEISWDGTSPETVVAKIIHLGRNKLKIQVPTRYALNNPSIKKVDNEYYLQEGYKSIGILLRGDGLWI